MVVDTQIIETSDRALVPAPAAGPVSLDTIIGYWLDAKASRSEKTLAAYAAVIAPRSPCADAELGEKIDKYDGGAFRRVLWEAGLDLDVQVPNGVPHPVTAAAQRWAKQPRPDGKPVTPATQAQRLAIISSFYTFALRRDFLQGKHPIAALDRPTVSRYEGALPLDAGDVAEQLAAINRASLVGMRDYALLSVALQTARRLSEVARLTWGDVALSRGRMTITFKAKGNKTMRDTLPQATAAVVLTWLHAVYGADLGTLAPDAPLWISLSRNPTNHGHRLSRQAVERICEQHIGTSRFHALRHTWAVVMERAGASLTTIQQRLGHASAATTAIYLHQLTRDENPHAEQIAAAFGIGTPSPAKTTRPRRGR